MKFNRMSQKQDMKIFDTLTIPVFTDPADAASAGCLENVKTCT